MVNRSYVLAARSTPIGAIDLNDTGFRKTLLRITAVSLGSICGLAPAESQFENTNLASFEVIPDVVAEGVKPYDERLWKTGKRIDGNACCDRKLYRVDGKKIVVLSHQGANFLVILITDNVTRMFIAKSPGVFVEKMLQNNSTWEIPDWLE
ncbi:MAG: hypothetical protein ACI9SB_002729 [Candidatus Azotimanducaceae bacterium]|jgi:hypothetical protein